MLLGGPRSTRPSNSIRALRYPHRVCCDAPVSEPGDEPDLAEPDLAEPDPTEPDRAEPDLSALAADVPWPDSAAEQAVRDRTARLRVPAGSLGRLTELTEWLAGAQGEAMPHEPRRPRLVVLGDADADTGADDTAAGPGDIVAPLAGAGLRYVSVRADLGFTDCVRLGVQLADAEVDAGADLLILGERGAATRTPGAAIVSLLTGVEPVRLVGQRDGIDDEQWIADVVAVRDTRRRGTPIRTEPAELLAGIGGATLTVMTAFLLRAAGRATPVLLDGAGVTAAALTARELAPRAIRWWQASHRSTDPTHVAALERLHLEPLLDLGYCLDGGAGAALALPLLTAAVGLFTQLPADAVDPDRLPVAEPDWATPPPEDGTNTADGADADVADEFGLSDVGEDKGWLDDFRADLPPADVENDG